MNENNSIQVNSDKNHIKESLYTFEDAIKEFDEIKNIALNCFDKNGNPNISTALKAVENKAKLAGLYKNTNVESKSFVKMNEIVLNGEQLKLNIGEEFIE